MANLGDLQINLNITPSKDTVQRCLQILSMYLTDNPNLTLKVMEYREADMIIRNAFLENVAEDGAMCK